MCCAKRIFFGHLYIYYTIIFLLFVLSCFLDTFSGFFLLRNYVIYQTSDRTYLVSERKKLCNILEPQDQGWKSVRFLAGSVRFGSVGPEPKISQLFYYHQIFSHFMSQSVGNVRNLIINTFETVLYTKNFKMLIKVAGSGMSFYK